ncbi:MAG: DedA family protein [Solirubrobacterales bacterium]|nr:DedA family protein [Solirubrobacterales bacterium]
MLVLASITDSVADWAIDVIDKIGLLGIFLLMTPESACIPIPSEPTMLFAGFSVHNGEYGLWAPVLVATVANLLGSCIAYAVGFYGRASVLTNNRLFHINDAQLDRAHGWFERYGAAAVFFSRMLPVVRTFISLPAGVARMRFSTFAVLTFLGALPWNLGLVLLGRSAAEKWPDWKNRLHYLDYAILALIVVGAAYLLLRWRRNRGRPADVAV